MTGNVGWQNMVRNGRPKLRRGAWVGGAVGAIALVGCSGDVLIGTGQGGTPGAGGQVELGDAGEAVTAGGQVPNARGGHTSQGGSTSSGGQTHQGGSVATAGAPEAGAPEAGQGGVGSVEPPLPLDHSNKLDLLLVVDNSPDTGGDTRKLFAESVNGLLEELTNPPCIKADNTMGTIELEGCPSGYRRVSAPLRDIHVGVITTSLGAHGGSVCTGTAENDKGRLLPAVRDGLDSYESQGFAKWDPDGQASPAGLSDASAFKAQVGNMLAAVGNGGCGYEASLEAWYRFLVDPAPWLNVQVTQENTSVAVGVDNVVLAQREHFLRPDSAVAILMLTSENDCSILDQGEGFLVASSVVGGGSFTFPRSRSICETDPNDPCCVSCSSPDVEGCGANADDPSCQLGSYTRKDDSMNLRCWDQKRRFGVDLLQPVDRYVRALTAPTVVDRTGATRPNPLFTPYHGKVRTPDLVVFGSILGVPWQDLSDEASWTSPGMHLLSASELAAQHRLEVIGAKVGAPPSDVFMRESAAPREGTNPLTGDSTVPPGTADPTASPINGHEFSPREALQFACIGRNSVPRRDPIACGLEALDSPICQNPAGEAEAETAYFYGAAPGLRQLQVLGAIGDSAVIGSICSKTGGVDEPDLGYTPTFNLLKARLAQVLE